MKKGKTRFAFGRKQSYIAFACSCSGNGCWFIYGEYAEKLLTNDGFVESGPMNISELLLAKEGENIEFKEAKNHFDFEELVKYACAISNAGGGRIVLGVSDKRPRMVVGSQAFPQPERNRKSLMDRLHIRVDFEVIYQDGKRILVFFIASRPIGLPVQTDGIAYWRSGDVLGKMPPEIVRKIYEESGHDFSADICPGAVFTDLDEHAIEAFRNKWIEKTKNVRLKTLTAKQLLTDCEAITPDGITYAALILFGKHGALSKYLAQAEIVFEYRSSDASGPAQQREEFRDAFFNIYERLWELINLRNDKQHYQDGLFVFDVSTFNESSTREALLNAVSHRNYQFCGSIFVIQYRDRLVISSPGGFPPGITQENIIDKQAPRNRRIAELLSKCGLVERSGQGMNLIYENSIKEAKDMPSFDGTDDNEVRLTLHGLVLDKSMLLLINKIGMETLNSFSTQDFFVLNYLARGEKLPLKLRNNTKRMIDLGLVEKIGRDNYILSRKYYSVAGKPGEHTRRAGLDRETNKALILKHIQEQHGNGAPLRELQQVLPALTWSQIQVLLRELVKDGKIYKIGNTRGAKWLLKEKQD